MKRFIGVLSLCLLLSGCSASGISEVENGIILNDSAMSKSYANETYDLADYESPNTLTTADTDITSNQKLIRTVNFTVTVESSEKITEVLEELQQYMREAGGYVTYVSTDFSNGRDRGSLNIKVPYANVDNFLSIVSSSGMNVTSMNDSYEDVTLEYTDVESRLKAKEAARDQYMMLLEDATSMEDMISIQRALNEVIEDLEAMQSRKNRLDNRIDYTAISINVNCKTSTSQKSFSERFADMASELIYRSSEVFLMCIMFVVCLAIVILFILPESFFMIRFVKFALNFDTSKYPWNRKKRRKEEKEE